jgi:hypothetical protein
MRLTLAVAGNTIRVNASTISKIERSFMRITRSLAVCTIAGAAVFAAAAQQKPANVMSIEFQTPKFGMTQQYEAGRKTKAGWHKEKKDPRPLFVWEIMTGPQTGTFVVGGTLVHWADLDNPPISEEVDVAEWEKVIGSSVQSLITHYYTYMPEMSHPGEGMMPSKYATVLTFNIRMGKTQGFLADMKRITGAINKTKWPAHYRFYGLNMGGDGNTFVLVIEHANYADFEEPAKPFPAMLTEALGKVEATALLARLDANTVSEERQMVKFRQDLSYIPDSMK